MPRTLPLRISIRDCLVLVLLVIFNTIHITDMGKSINELIENDFCFVPFIFIMWFVYSQQ